MVALSKPTLLECTCYELGHCWTPSCRQAAFDVFKDVSKEALKIYGSLYFIAGLVRRRGKAYFRKKFWLELLQSTSFLTINGTLFIACFCIWRKLAGFYFYPCGIITGIPASGIALSIERKERKLVGSFYFVNSVGFLPALVASFIAILHERKSRRGLLAVYMANIATETVWRMLKARGWVKSIHNGEVLLFSVASAVYLYCFKKGILPDGTMSTFKDIVISETFKKILISNHRKHDEEIRRIFGSEECPLVEESRPSHENLNGSNDTSSSSMIANQKRPYKSVIRLIERCQQWLQQYPTHPLCRHSHSCLYHALQGSIRLFGIGYSIQAVIKVVSSIRYIIKQPKSVISALTHTNNVEFGAFLASLVGLYRGINCILRWIRNKDEAIHGAISGFCAGWSMLFYKSQTIALYTASKLVEMLYFKGIERGQLPYIKCADIIVYSISTALVFHAAVLEPHNLRPAYWKFLLRVTGNKFAHMNRRLLDPYIPDCSKINPDYWPNYDMRYSNLVKPTS